MKLFEKIKGDLERLGFLPALKKCDTVLCALSGGADSVVLLHFLHWYLPGQGIHLAAAHLHHGIRGAAADADEAFCRRLCERLQIPFYSRRLDIPAMAKEAGLGLEECARIQRYAFLEEIAASLPHPLIATAHNATDHLETVLFHLVRGTGAKGLCGISPMRDEEIIRPLLCCTAKQVRDYAKAAQLSYVTDATNADTTYTRNYIREKVVPALRQLNPRCETAALRMSELLRADLAYLEEAAAALLREDGFLSIETAAGAPDPLLSRSILTMYRWYMGDKETLSGVHLSDCMALIRSGRPGRISLPGRAALFSQGGRVWIGADPAFTKTDVPAAVPISVGDAVFFGPFLVKVSREQADIVPSDQNIYNLAIYGTLDFAKINNSLYIRARRAGDVYYTGGMHKKIKKLFTSMKIPAHLRDVYPLLCDGEGILWVPGLRPRDGCAGAPDPGGSVYIGVWYAGEK